MHYCKGLRSPTTLVVTLLNYFSLYLQGGLFTVKMLIIIIFFTISKMNCGKGCNLYCVHSCVLSNKISSKAFFLNFKITKFIEYLKIVTYKHS